MPRPALVVLTRDLRVRDNPALVAAARGAEHVVPLFVLDDRVLGRHASPNRIGFLLEALADLDRSLRRAGAALVVRRGDWEREVVRAARDTGAGAVHVAEDVSALARRRLDRLAAVPGIELHRHPGITVVPPDELRTGDGRGGGRGYRVFTPYHRRWSAAPWRAPLGEPGPLRLPPGVDTGRLPALVELVGGRRSPDVVPGGETAGLARLRRWAAGALAAYAERRDDLAGAATSQISPYLHLGCLSPLEVAHRLRDRPGGRPFVRQVCWRDFFHQLLAHRPDAAHADYRARGDRWSDDPDALAAWREGRTGYPVVDAGLRQLRREGFMPNRARMIVASFLTKDLYLDWRAGADHFMSLLVDGDVACNQLNWQWVAGTGTDTNAHRVLSPLRQAERFDPAGDYVRRHVDELADIGGPAVHDPPAAQRRSRGYPEPIVDHRDAVAAYRARRSAG